MKPFRVLKLETIFGAARDGGNIFAVTAAKPRISFQYMLDGVEVVEKKCYDKLLKELELRDTEISRLTNIRMQDIKKLLEIQEQFIKLLNKMK